MILNELIKDIDLRFTSGNKIPVERAYIKADEWERIKNVLICCGNCNFDIIKDDISLRVLLPNIL